MKRTLSVAASRVDTRTTYTPRAAFKCRAYEPGEAEDDVRAELVPRSVIVHFGWACREEGVLVSKGVSGTWSSKGVYKALAFIRV